MDTSNPAPLIFVDQANIITGWSDGAELMLGWREGEVVGKPLSEIWNEEAGSFNRANGSPVALLVSKAPVPGGQTVLALRQPERISLQEKLDLTLSHSDIIGSWDWDVAKNLVTADVRFAETFGVDPNQARLGLPLERLVESIHAADRDRVSAEIDHTLRTGEAFRSEYRVYNAAGGIQDVVARGRVIPGDGVRPTRFPGVVFDITQRRSAERTAGLMEKRYRSLFETIDAGFCIVGIIRDAEGNPIDYEFLEVNPAFVQQTGIEDAVGKRMRTIAPSHEQHWFDLYGKVAQTQEPIQFENPAEALGRWYEVHAFPIDAPELQHVAILFMDKTQQRKTAQDLRKSEAEFRSLSESMLNLVWTADREGKPTWINVRASEFSGLDHETLLRDGLRSIIHPEDLPGALDAWKAALQSATLFQTEHRMRRADGVWRWHLVRGVPVKDEDGLVVKWIGTNTDIEHAKRNAAALADLNTRLEQRVEERTSELLQAQRLLQQAQKMETLGQLTGGVAHDFNNLLQVIGGNLQLLLKDVVTNERAERRVANALSGVSRGAKLASQLLAFGRRQALEPRVVNLRKFLGGMDDLLRRSIGEAVEVEIIASGGLWNTQIDPTQLENAVLNLAINARDAMEGAGKLTIEVGNGFLDNDYVLRHEDVQPGQYVVVSVTDTGSGMPSEVIDKVFEPFFSTKPEGQGTGLGLSMVYGFVKQSGGHVTIYSEVGHGTTVRLYLPRSASEEDREIVPIDIQAVGGSEAVLVVEDDDEVRETVVEMLRDLGYRVLTARDAQAGLTVIESGVPIDVLFTDVIMPGPLKSSEMARLAKERMPKLAVLFTSGYTENSIVHGGKLDPGVELLSKPYSRDALARRLRHVIANEAQRAHAASSQLATEASGQSMEPTTPLTILLVEDEPLIRMSAADMLVDLGYEVIEASNASEALEVVTSRAVDVMMTDVGLPDLSGGELAFRARQHRPALPIVFATGDSRPPVDLDRTWLLTKPYDDRMLKETLRAVSLDR